MIKKHHNKIKRTTNALGNLQAFAIVIRVAVIRAQLTFTKDLRVIMAVTLQELHKIMTLTF